MKRISSSSDPNILIYAPIMTGKSHSGEVFAMTAYNPQVLATDTNSQFEVDVDTTNGEHFVKSNSLGTFLSVSKTTDNEDTIVVSFKTRDSTSRGWEFIQANFPNVTSKNPSWALNNKKGQTPNLADGIYRVTNAQTKTCMALSPHGADLGAKGVVVTGDLKEVSRQI